MNIIMNLFPNQGKLLHDKFEETKDSNSVEELHQLSCEYEKYLKEHPGAKALKFEGGVLKYRIAQLKEAKDSEIQSIIPK